MKNKKEWNKRRYRWRFEQIQRLDKTNEDLLYKIYGMCPYLAYYAELGGYGRTDFKRFFWFFLQIIIGIFYEY